MKILDGKGTGRSAEVSGENRLQVDSVATSAVVKASQVDLSAYTMSSPILTVTTTKGAMLWFYNSSATDSFCVERMIGSWNGDSTNHNRVCEVEYCIGMTQPSGNATAGAIRALNSNSSLAASGSMYYWSEASTGMTVSSNGIVVGSIMVNQGITDLRFEGAVVVAPGATLGITAKAQDATGEFSVIISGYYKEL